jgi:hypothetical protein
MRVPINLSSEPFRKDRPVLIASSLGAVLLAGLLGLLILQIVSERQRAQETRVGVARLTAQLRTITTEEAKFDSFLREPQNAVVLETRWCWNAACC